MYSPTYTVLLTLHIIAQFGAALASTLGVHQLVGTSIVGISYLVQVLAGSAHLTFFSTYDSLLIEPMSEEYDRMPASDLAATVPQSTLTSMSIVSGFINMIFSIPILIVALSGQDPDVPLKIPIATILSTYIGNSLWIITTGIPALWLCLDYESAKKSMEDTSRAGSHNRQISAAPAEDCGVVGSNEAGTEVDLEKGAIDEEEEKLEVDSLITQMTERTPLIRRDGI